MPRLLAVMLLVLLSVGCATIGQKNRGQPFVLPEELKEQVVDTRIRHVERLQGNCTLEVPKGQFLIPREAWQTSGATIINSLEQPGDYEIRYVFWGCEHLLENGGPANRRMGAFALTAMTASIIPFFYDTYSNLTVTVTRDQEQVFEATYRERTGGRVYGVLVLPFAFAQWVARSVDKESVQLTSYRNLARQFNEDIRTEYLFD